MFSKLREILLTQYIGSILIALLVWQAAIEVITSAVRTGFWFSAQHHSESVLGGSSFGRSSRAPFPWDNLIFAASTLALYLLTAYGLARWLYPPASTVPQPDAEVQPAPDEPS